MATDRDAQLRPSTIGDYEVDDLSFLKDLEYVDRVRRDVIIPYAAKHANLFKETERKQLLYTRDRPNRLFLTKALFSTSVDVTFTNFQKVIRSGQNSYAFLPEAVVLAHLDPKAYDTLVLYRTIRPQSEQALEDARAQGKNVIYAMDDNMFRFSELGSQFDYLAIGSPQFHTVAREVADADVTIAYSSRTADDCREFSPRVLDLSTNILARYIEPSEPLPDASNRRLRYAVFSGPGVREDEFQALWPEFVRFAEDYQDQIEFHLWGFEADEYAPLACPCHKRPFTHSYDQYLEAVAAERFEFMLSPLFADSNTKRSKCPVKYLEATMAGAVGIYSDTVVYAAVEDGRTGIKVRNEPGCWYEALCRSAELPDDQRLELFQRAKEDVLARFTTESQLLAYGGVFEAADLHAKLQSYCSPDGQARIGYFFHEPNLGGGTQHLLKHALLARQFGFQPVLFLPEDRMPSQHEFYDRARELDLQVVGCPYRLSAVPSELTDQDRRDAEQIVQALGEYQIALVHQLVFSPAVIRAAELAKIPCVVTQHAVEGPAGEPASEEVPRPSVVHSSSLRYAQQWGRKLGVPTFMIRAPIEEKYFQEYAQRKDRSSGSCMRILLSGTLQERKGQLKAIQAVKELVRRGRDVQLTIVGYDHFFPEYVQTCRQAIVDARLEDRVKLLGFTSDPGEVYAQSDALLCASDLESMPQTILKAMASGLEVITTPVGGVGEVLIDGFHGTMTSGFEVEDLVEGIEQALAYSPERRRQMLERAHQTARMICREEVVGFQLLRLYNRAYDEYVKRFGIEQAAQARQSRRPKLKGILTVSGERGGKTRLHGIYADNTLLPFREELPAGWALRPPGPGHGPFYFHDGQHDLPLEIPVDGHKISLRFVAASDSKAVHIRLGELRQDLETCSEKPEFRKVYLLAQKRKEPAKQLEFKTPPVKENTAVQFNAARQRRGLPIRYRPVAPHREDWDLLAPKIEVQPTPPLHPKRIYRIDVTSDFWSGLSILCGTHQRPCRGMLRVEIFSDGECLRDFITSLSDIRDNSVIRIKFKPISNSSGKQFRVVFQVEYEDDESRFSLYEQVEGKAGFYTRFRRRLLHEGHGLHCQMHFSPSEIP